MKKLIGILLCAVMAFATAPLMTACGGKSDLTILVMANNIENNFYEDHFKKLGEQLGITIEYKFEAASSYYDKLSAEITRGSTPDIIYVRPSNIRQFVKDGLIDSVEKEVKEQTAVDLTKIYESALTSYRYDKSSKTLGTGELYAIPKDLSVQQLGYNKTLIARKETALRAAGIAKMPWEMDWGTENYTWEEYLTMAKICTDTSDTTNPVYGCDIPDVEILTWGNGGKLLSDDKQTVQASSQAVKDAIRYQARLIAEGAGNYAGATYDNFGSGKVAFYGLVNSFDIQNFEFMFESLGHEWDIMPWPVVDKAQPHSWKGIIGTAGYAVTTAAKDKKLAVDVVMSLLTEQTQDQLVKDAKLMLPLYKQVAEDSFSSPDFDDVYAPKSRKIYIDVISGTNGNFSADNVCYDTLWRDPLKSYLETLYGTAPDKIMAALKTDAAYDALNAQMQTEYNKTKNQG